MNRTRIGQFVLETLTRNRPGRFTDEITLRFFRRLRQWLIMHGDPLIQYRLNTVTLRLPLSHNLPITQARLPNYSLNVGRVACHVQTKYPALTAIDIGANVGDTVVIMRGGCHFPILCIEGDQRFFALLQQNTAGQKDVCLEQTFVGTETTTVRGFVAEQKGTATVIVDGQSSGSVSFKALVDILAERPEFSQPKLIKIDTDGFDTQIVMANLTLLEKLKPVLFFEYIAPPFTPEQCEPFEVFAGLRSVGYKAIMVYEETGEYAFTADLENTRLMEDVFRFYSGRRDKRYCDLVAFHDDDTDLCETIRLAELDYFCRFRAQRK